MGAQHFQFVQLQLQRVGSAVLRVLNQEGMMVMVLTISCQVSLKPKIGPLINQTAADFGANSGKPVEFGIPVLCIPPLFRYPIRRFSYQIF